MKSIFVLLLTLCFSHSFADNRPHTRRRFVSTYYIDPSGNDGSGTGSLLAPWKTLRKATATVTTLGDIIHVNAGSYTETLQSTLAPGVSIEGVGITSIIKSTATADFTSIIVASSAEGTNGNQHITGLKFDGQSTATALAILIQGRSNFSVYNCTAIDFRQEFVYWRGRNDNTNGAPTTYATGNSFHDNIVTNCAGYDAFGHGQLMFGGQDGMLVYNNIMTQDSRGSGNNGWPIKHQANNGYSKNVRVYSNIFTKDPDYGGTWDFAVESFHNENWQVDHNAFHGGGLDMNFQTGTTGITYNTFDYPVIPVLQYQSAITLEFGSTGVTVQNNTCNGASSFVLFTPRDGNTVRDIDIDNNLSYHMGLSGVDGYGIRWNTSGMASGATIILRNLQINHNTFVSLNALYGARLPDGNPDVINAIVDADSIYLKNNILTGFITTPAVANPAAGINHIWYINNIFFDNGNADLPIYNGGSPMNPVTTGALTSDPLLNAFYLPGLGSPALGAASDGGNIGYQVPASTLKTVTVKTKVILLVH